MTSLNKEEQDFLDMLSDKVYVIVELIYDKSRLHIFDASKAVIYMENPNLKIVSDKLYYFEARKNINYRQLGSNYPRFIARYNNIKVPILK